jgi:cytochrome c-type biogenesis protein
MRRRILASTLAFVFGFSIVFILLGATAAYFSGLLQGARIYLRVAGGALIILLGLHLLGVLRIRALDIEKRAHLKQKPVHLLGTVLIGMAFGAGWSPCIGPMLGSILILAGNQDTVAQGVGLLSLYSAGLALPFIALSMGIHFLFTFVRRAARAIRVVNIAAGILLILTGLLLVTDKLRLLTNFSF